VSKSIAKISTSGIAIVSMLDGYSRQCSTIGFLSNSWASCKVFHMQMAYIFILIIIFSFMSRMVD